MLTTQCKNCKRDIYSAGGDAQKGDLGWLHQDSGEAKCEQSQDHATPEVDGMRVCPKCGAEMQATVKIDLSDVVIQDGEIVGYRIVINGEDALAARLTLKEAIDQAIASAMDKDYCHVYCDNDHDFPDDDPDEDKDEDKDEDASIELVEADPYSVNRWEEEAERRALDGQPERIDFTWTCAGPCRLTFGGPNATDNGTSHSEGCGEATCFKCLDKLKGVCPSCKEPLIEIYIPSATARYTYLPDSAATPRDNVVAHIVAFSEAHPEHNLYEISRLPVNQNLRYADGSFLLRLGDAFDGEDADAPITELPVWYDYENQAWVRDCVYATCGHDKNLPCPRTVQDADCYGRTHAGEVPTAELTARYGIVNVSRLQSRCSHEPFPPRVMQSDSDPAIDG